MQDSKPLSLLLSNSQYKNKEKLKKKPKRMTHNKLLEYEIRVHFEWFEIFQFLVEVDLKRKKGPLGWFESEEARVFINDKIKDRFYEIYDDYLAKIQEEKRYKIVDELENLTTETRKLVDWVNKKFQEIIGVDQKLILGDGKGTFWLLYLSLENKKTRNHIDWIINKILIGEINTPKQIENELSNEESLNDNPEKGEIVMIEDKNELEV